MSKVNKEKKRLIESLQEQARDEAALRSNAVLTKDAMEASHVRTNAIYEKIRTLNNA